MISKEKAAFRKTKVWKSFRENLIIENNYECKICGIKKKKGLHCHHKHLDNYTNLDSKRFTILCSSCHKLGHDILRRKKRNKTIEDIKNILEPFIGKEWRK